MVATTHSAQRSGVPLLSAHLDGNRLPSSVAAGLDSVRIERRLSEPAQCELGFTNLAAKTVRDLDFRIGQELLLEIPARSRPLFFGFVTAVEYRMTGIGEHVVHLRAYDPLHGLQQQRAVRSRVDVTPQELAQELLAEVGLQLQAQQSGPVLRQLIQWRESNLSLLRNTTERYGLYYAFNDRDQVELFTLAGCGEPISLNYGTTLQEVCVELNVDGDCAAVSTTGWNPWDATTHRVESAHSDAGTSAGLAGALHGEAPTLNLLGETAQTPEQSAALAQAELDRRTAGRVSLRGTAVGDVALAPGQVVDLSGLAEPQCGRYVLTEVSHRLDRRVGFVTEFSTAPPPLKRRPAGTMTTVGVVSAIGDPDGLSRVRVRLPGFDDLETDWLNVLCLGAGADKGLNIMPDLEDRVVVLLAQEDPGQGLVLGGLYGSGRSPDCGVSGAAVGNYNLMTRGGQTLRLDQERDLIRLENSGGNSVQIAPGRIRLRNSGGSEIELSRDQMQLQSTTDLTIAAPGRRITIRAAAIDFEQG